ncbi:MAG: lmo0937 family membrane protein [Bacteroidia bacterium]|nr:lmo0937 family membrane protein [Bacteroidia bacterium]
MKNVNYILALILIILWVVGFFTHFIGHPIHLLLIGALTLIFINVLRDDNNNTTQYNN